MGGTVRKDRASLGPLAVGRRGVELHLVSPPVSRAGLALALSLLAQPCDGGPSQGPNTVAGRPVDPASRLFRAPLSDFAEPTELAVRDAGAWRATWDRLTSNTFPPRDLPAVDFAREVVVLVAAGRRASGGWSVSIDSVATEASGARVSYTVTGPAPGCAAAQVVTAPVDVVRVPRVAGTVRFAGRTVLAPC